MVGQLISLKLRIIWNTIRRQTAILVLSIIGAVYLLAYVAGAFVSVAFLARSQGADAAAPYFAAVGPLVTVLWIVLPILFSSMDNSLAPERLSPYVGPSKRLGVALAGATVVGPGGVLSALTLLIPVWFSLWRGHWVHALGWLLAACITLATSVLWARALGTWFAIRLNTSSRKDLVTVLGVTVFMVVLTPMGFWLNVLASNFSFEAVRQGLEVALWTPFGASFGTVSALAAHNWVAALIRAFVAAASLCLGWRAWLAVLRPVMSGYAGPISGNAQRAIDEGRHLVDESLAKPQRVAHKEVVGLRSVDFFTGLGMGPRSASLAARTLRYWIVDPRLNMNLVLALLFPIVAVLVGRVNIEGQTVVFTGIFLYLVPMTTGLSTGALMQYDSTGAWVVVSSGMSGVEERRGRLIGSLPALAPQVVGYLIHDTLVGASPVDFVFHQVMGLVLFSGAAATTLICHARWVYPVQPPGTSPLATKGTGSFLLTMVLQLVGFVGTVLLQIVSFAALALATFGLIPQWVAYAVAITWSLIVLEAGVRIGGRIWDRYCVKLLTTIRSWPGH